MSLPHSLLPSHHCTFILVGPWAPTNYPKDKKRRIIHTITSAPSGMQTIFQRIVQVYPPCEPPQPYVPCWHSLATQPCRTFLPASPTSTTFQWIYPEEAYLVRLCLRRARCCACLFWEPSENHWIWRVVSPLRVQGPGGGL